MTAHTSDIEKEALASGPPRKAIIGPVAANVAFVMELTLVPLLLPAIQLHFDLSISELAWVFNSYSIAVAVGVLLGGWCGDAFNTRKVFGYGVAFFAAGSLIVAAADSFEMLIAGRILQGLGGGIFAPLVPLLLTRALPQKPGRALIVWGSISGYLAAFAPLFYGSFLGGDGWKTAFIFIAIIAAIALLVLSGSPSSKDPAPYTGRPADYSALFQARDLWMTFLYVFCTYGSITYYLFRLPVWLSENEVEAASIGFVLSIMWLTFSCLSTLLRNKVDSPHLGAIMFAAPLLIVAGFPLLYLGDNFLLLIASSVLVGSGLACSNAPSTQLILRFAPKGMSAVSTSLDITFARFGGIAAVALLAETEFAYAAVAIGLSCLAAAVCALTANKGLADEG
ncbi:MFS transporter [uncultured Roseobacter sp.]|uniref:MFS transporter n=1 Tax=uncultured Roseobacter sp. TaxID=114847 RepID=UPI0026382DD7|nr:MFS transporter [uncultured Roseobacter sp.]